MFFLGKNSFANSTVMYSKVRVKILKYVEYGVYRVTFLKNEKFNNFMQSCNLLYHSKEEKLNFRLLISFAKRFN